MIGDAGLAAKLAAIPDRHTAGNAGLARDDAVPADADVVGDLHQVIDLGILADDGVLVGTPIVTPS